MRIIPVLVVGFSFCPGFGGVLRAATPTMHTPITIITNAII